MVLNRFPLYLSHLSRVVHHRLLELYGIKVTKPRTLLHMIQRLELKGHEKVLDLGCGRGLLLCKIAQYLPQGMAYGIDL